MRSRFFGASSYDDDDEEEEMDLSGFVTSSETQPVVVERKRAPKADTGATEASNMGNAGPRTTPPPPMGEMGYSPKLRSPVAFADSGAGSPWNPVWASDDSRLKKAAVVSKSVGMLGIAGGIAYAAGKKQFKGVPGKVMAGSLALYLHPALGWNHGQLDRWVGDKGMVANLGGKALAQGVGAVAFYQLIKRL